MGVPHFINWLVSRYPLIAKRMNCASRPKIDCFFIDFNCIVHNSMRANKTINEANSKEEIMKEVLRFLDILVQIVCPTSLLFISVDGPAPLAKCRQQRSRRFIREINPDPTSNFESNAISVGTEFMENLHQRLSKFLEERVKDDLNWKKPTVIYSSYRTPGEGEHKFFDFIRSQRKFSFWNENASCCVYSPDADLVFVCLQSNIKNFCILRESNAIFPEIKTKNSVNDSGIKYFPNDFVLLSVNLIREYLHLDFESDDPRIFDDFTALSYLIGNDFIPHFPDVKIEKGEFSIIVDLYKNDYLKKGKFLVNGLAFNSQFLAEFIRDAVLQIAKIKKKANSLEQLVQLAEDKICSRMPEEYEKDAEGLKRSLSYSIIDSFYWVLQYYKNGVPSWTWFYPYYYAPSLIIVANYITEHEPNFEVGSPPTPYEQLLSIMPPQSKSLLPKALQPLMEPDSPIGYLYPTQFKVVGGKVEGTAIVPFVDIYKVKQAFQTVVPNLTKEEKERNQKIPPLIIKANELSFTDETRKVINFNLFVNDPNPPCIPSLFFHGIKPTVTSFPSYEGNHTLNLSFSIPVNKKNAPSVVQKTILVGYPYFIPAIVQNIVESNQLSNQNQNIVNDYMKIYGLDISNTSCYLNVRVLQFADTYESSLQWSKETTLFPFQLTAPLSTTNTILRFKPTENQKPKIDSLAVINRGKNKGTLCRIKKMTKYNFEVTKIIHPKRICDMQLILEDDEQRWIPLSRVASYFNLNIKIMESVLTDLHTEKYPLNFAFIIIKDNKGVQGFCTKVKNEICITQQVVQLLRSYFDKADPLLLALKTFNETENSLESILDEYIDTYEEVKIEKIRKWVKENSPSRNFPYVKMYKHFPARETIERIEKIMINENQPDTEDTAFIQENPNNLIWKGKVDSSSIENVHFGSRVITTNPTGIVSFGTYGVVIGTSFNGQLAHIIADNEFQYGNQMQGCLKTSRGFILSTRYLSVFE